MQCSQLLEETLVDTCTNSQTGWCYQYSKFMFRYEKRVSTCRLLGRFKKYSFLYDWRFVFYCLFGYLTADAWFSYLRVDYNLFSRFFQWTLRRAVITVMIVKSYCFMKYIKKHKRQCFIAISKNRQESWKWDVYGGVFLTKFRGVWIAHNTLSRVFDISSQLKQVRSKRRSKSWASS